MITSSPAFAQAEMQYRQARLVAHEMESYRRTRRSRQRAPRRRLLRHLFATAPARTA